MSTPTPVPAAQLARRFAHTSAEIGRFALRRAHEEKLFQVAASLTFTTILSIVPLATTIFGVMTALPVFDRLRDALHAFFESHLFPEAISTSFFGYLDQFSANASSLTIVSLVSFAVTSLLTMLTIDDALNTIWGVHRSRPLAQRIVTYWAILSIGPILLGVSLTLASYLASASAGLVTAPTPIVELVLDVVPLLAFAAAYTALYMFVPYRRVDVRDAFVGALVAAIAFEAAKRGFAEYIARFRLYAMVYGALAALPLLLLWIYYIWIITLVGALIAASLPAIYGRSWNRGNAPGEAFADALRVLRALYRARRVDRAGYIAGLDTQSIRQRAHLDYWSTDAILEKLEQDGLVVRTRPLASTRRFRRTLHDEVWLFAADPSVVRIDRVFRLFALDADHAGAIGLASDDPLGAFIRRQRLEDADAPLLDALIGEESEAESAVTGDVADRTRTAPA